MFHIRTGLIAGIVTLLCVTAQPTPSYANGPTSPAAQTLIQTQVEPTSEAAHNKYTDMSLLELRQETRTKLSESKQWVKDQPAVEGFKGLVKDMGQATDDFQTRTAPLGNSIKASFETSLPGKSLAQQGDKTFSVFGLILILAFAFVFLMMGFSGPASRLGGRH